MLKKWLRGWLGEDKSQKEIHEEPLIMQLGTSIQWLPAKYRDWLSPESVIPNSVQYIPADKGVLPLILPGLLGLVWVFITVVFLGSMFHSLRSFTKPSDIVFTLIFEGGSFIISLVVTIYYLTGVKDLIQITRMQLSGKVRYGIFIDNDVMLFRQYTPDREYCHLIPHKFIENVELKMKITPSPASRTIKARRVLILGFNQQLHRRTQIELPVSWLDISEEGVYHIVKKWVTTNPSMR